MVLVLLRYGWRMIHICSQSLSNLELYQQIRHEGSLWANQRAIRCPCQPTRSQQVVVRSACCWKNDNKALGPSVTQSGKCVEPSCTGCGSNINQSGLGSESCKDPAGEREDKAVGPAVAILLYVIWVIMNKSYSDTKYPKFCIQESTLEYVQKQTNEHNTL